MPMSRFDQNFKVFVSSTSEDLQDYRGVARAVINKMGWKADMMEDWGALPERTIQACYERLKDCGLMVLIVAFRRGWVPTTDEGGNGEDSVTALELQYARDNHIQVLAFLAKENWPGNLWDDDAAARAWIKKFREGLNLPAAFFGYEEPTTRALESLPGFRTLLSTALVSHRERLLKEEEERREREQEQQRQTGRPMDSGGFAMASEWLQNGEGILFVGTKIYEQGPLSTPSLMQALADEHCNEPCLASAAEFAERKKGTRPLFLKHLGEIITEKTRLSKLTAPPSVYDLLVKIKKPPLIVSATGDLLLEEQLAAAGKQLVILCHVLRARNAMHAGKVIMFRGLDDADPQFYLADKINLEEFEGAYIFYKPLGSPLLHRRLKPDLEIDTVVITEADYLILLGGLQDQSSGVPNAIRTCFRMYPAIFLGYPMDMWHFRLVGQVFQAVGVLTSRRLAIREPALPMEELAWDRLGIDMVPMNPNAFATEVMKP